MTAEQREEIAQAMDQVGEVIQNLAKSFRSGDIATFDELEDCMASLYREEIRDLDDAIRDAQEDEEDAEDEEADLVAR